MAQVVALMQIVSPNEEHLMVFADLLMAEHSHLHQPAIHDVTSVRY